MATHAINIVPLERLQEITSGSEQDLNLAEAALLIAREQYPDLDVGAYLRQLDELAAHVRRQLPPRPGLEDMIATLNQCLFEEQGFAGNTDDYYDPRNSFLNEVLDRKLGIPITLSILYMEVGRRLGLALEGVSFPGHFLVKFATEEGDIVLDPFLGGIPLTEEDLMERLEETYGEQAVTPEALGKLLDTAGKKDILVRMLRNLKNIYVRARDFNKALWVSNRILLIMPQLPEELRDRGEIHERLECFRAALDDYRRYLAVVPQADDAEDIHKRVVSLRKLVSNLN